MTKLKTRTLHHIGQRCPPFLLSRKIGDVAVPPAVQAEVLALKNEDFTGDYNQFSLHGDGIANAWSTAPLANKSGSAASSETLVYEGGAKWTPLADRLPATTAFARYLLPSTGLLSVRLFRAGPNSGIRAHRDYLELLNNAKLNRIHCALTTNDGCLNGEFNGDGADIAFHCPVGTIAALSGEAVHFAANLGATVRIHLVADFESHIALDQCLQDGIYQEGKLQLVDRPPLPPEVYALLRVAAKAATLDSIDDLLDYAERLCIRFRARGLSYDQLLPHVGDRPELVDALLQRRAYFTGM